MRYVSSCGCTCPLSQLLDTRATVSPSRVNLKSIPPLQPLLKSVAFKPVFPSPNLILLLPRLSLNPPPPPLHPPDKKELDRSKILPRFRFFHHRQIVHTIGYYIASSKPFFPRRLVPRNRNSRVCPVRWRPTNHIYVFVLLFSYSWAMYICIMYVSECVYVCVCISVSCTMQAFVRAPIIFTT